MFLSLRGIVKRFGAVTALDGVSLDVAEGEFVCFLGPSGCGKTTLLRSIAGLELPEAGSILLGGEELARTPARLRNFGVVFQSYSLFPNMTVARNLAYGLECRGWKRSEIEERVARMLSLVRLDNQAEKYPHQLSGGQQQRIALARALAPRPRMLLLDEPLSALDAKVRDELRGEIRDLQRALGVTTIMVTHDQDEAMEIADRIVLMNDGRIEQVGSAADLYERPASRFVAAFVGRMNVLPLAGGAFAGVSFSGMAAQEVVGIRPEHVELCTAEHADAIAGRVEKSVFLGSVTRVTLAVGGGRMVIELRGRVADLAPGSPLAVRLPPDALHRLSGGPH
ncbi:MAG: ATP-binding cassette domain-containing protein [Rhodospirillales bacterium]|nr:ATP-binding cassette domain-containing protein [Rhodospirillales bacterium]